MSEVCNYVLMPSRPGMGLNSGDLIRIRSVHYALRVQDFWYDEQRRTYQIQFKPNFATDRMSSGLICLFMGMFTRRDPVSGRDAWGMYYADDHLYMTYGLSNLEGLNDV